MKRIFRTFGIILGVGLLSAFVLSSCSKDKDPADTDVFVGKYKGHITFLDNDDAESKVDKEEGTVEVIKVGKNYNFVFSDGIPDLTGVEFEEKDDHTVINIGSDDNHLISIDGHNLKIAYLKDGKLWTANCKR